MPKVNVYNLKGEVVSSVKLSDEVFGAEYNEGLIHQVVVAHLANARQGTRATKTRPEVRGHAKKPWRQKGTGRARQGSSKGPQWVGGGIAFGPQPQDFSQKINKQAKKTAFLSALSTKISTNELKVVENLNLENVKTKEVVGVLDNLKINNRTIFVTNGKDENVLKASANIPNVTVTTSDLLNTYEVVANGSVVITLDAIKSIEEANK